MTDRSSACAFALSVTVCMANSLRAIRRFDSELDFPLIDHY
jgi:hypothetical protein